MCHPSGTRAAIGSFIGYSTSVFEIDLICGQAFDPGIFHFKHIAEYRIQKPAVFPGDANGAFHNHNILFFESSNLACLAFYFSAFKDAKQWRESGQQRMMGALHGAVLADGCNVEAAPRYHFIYLREPCLMMNASSDSGIPMIDGFAETARRQGAKMADYWARLCSPTGTVPSLVGTTSPVSHQAPLAMRPPKTTAAAIVSR